VNRYRISLNQESTANPAVIITVDVDTGSARIVDVRFEGEASFPAELADVDIRPVLRAVTTMLGDRAVVNGPALQQEKQSPAGQPRPGRRGGTGASRTPTDRKPRNSAPSDLGAMYWRLGTIGKVAKHYDVPHHIARTWIHDLQQTGSIPNPWSARNSPPPPTGGRRRRV
jgi:hypothetical protein